MQTKKTLRILVVIAAVVATILICRFVAQRSATPQPLAVEEVRKQLERVTLSVAVEQQSSVVSILNRYTTRTPTIPSFRTSAE